MNQCQLQVHLFSPEESTVQPCDLLHQQTYSPFQQKQSKSIAIFPSEFQTIYVSIYYIVDKRVNRNTFYILTV